MNYLSDTLARIRNGLNIKLYNIKVLNSKLIRNVLNVMYKEGFIQGYKVNTKFNNKGVIDKYLEVLLKYDNFGVPVITSLTQISKPGCRTYVSVTELLSLYKREGSVNSVFVVSTSKGVVSARTAIELNVGGELLFKIN